MDNIKKFEDFLGRMQGLLDNAKKQGHIIVRVEDLENAFPELKESEDEKIREYLIRYIDNTMKSSELKSKLLAWLKKQGELSIKWNKNTEGNKPQVNHSVLLKTTHGIAEGEWYGGEYWTQYRWSSNTKDSDVIAWMELSDLEKQGEQKPVDKVEPKFHEGDWAVSNLDGKARQISEVHFDEYNSYYVVDGKSVNLEEYDRLHHLWTIQDAKDGDVLATSAGAFIYNGNRGGGSCPGSYCGINTLGRFKTGVETHWTGKTVKPATNEQRDTLFAKMKEAGYEWDIEKKELKKIENRPMLSDFFNAEYERGKADALKSVNWSNEDEGFLNLLLSIFTNEHPNGVFSTGDITPFNGICVTSNRIIDWLKSLKYKVCPKQKWSEEDKRMIDNIIFELEENQENISGVGYKIDWLKSIKDRNLWKPSEEQMVVLELASKYERVFTPKQIDILIGLKEQLKENYKL